MLNWNLRRAERGTESMRKAIKQILVCAAGLLVICVFCRFAFFDHLDVYIPQGQFLGDEPRARNGEEEPRFTIRQPEVLRTGSAEKKGKYLRVEVYPQGRGKTEMISDSGANGAGGHTFRVDRFHTVYDLNTGNFTGDSVVLAAVTLFWMLVTAIMVWHFLQARGPRFYGYGSIYYAGFSLFSLSTAIAMLAATLSHLFHPEQYSMYTVWSIASGASIQYMMLSAPLVLLFAGALAVSNAALLRHQRFRLPNLLGILIGALLALGELAGRNLFSLEQGVAGEQGKILHVLLNAFATVFVYFQCMLTGSVLCSLLAARHQPAPDKDFIIIHGCWFRPDGTLPPLLRSRTDRALEFWRWQRAQTGKKACFVPSGGKGSDEPMPEAEAIRNYLLAEGVEDRLILPEDRSVSTLENMAFCRQIIERANPAAKTVFATSSYHVFRSGILARQVGLEAEGIGGKTRWWFWPNAFLRETAGLMLRRWKQELLCLLLLIAFLAALAAVL